MNNQNESITDLMVRLMERLRATETDLDRTEEFFASLLAYSLLKRLKLDQVPSDDKPESDPSEGDKPESGQDKSSEGGKGQGKSLEGDKPKSGHGEEGQSDQDSRNNTFTVCVVRRAGGLADLLGDLFE